MGTEDHAANWFVTRDDDLVWIEPQFNNQASTRAGKSPIISGDAAVTHLQLVMF